MVKEVRSGAGTAPSFENIKSSIYRALERDRNPNAKNAQAIKISEEWTKTINGSNFLLKDIKEKDGRTLVRIFC